MADRNEGGRISNELDDSSGEFLTDEENDQGQQRSNVGTENDPRALAQLTADSPQILQANLAGVDVALSSQ